MNKKSMDANIRLLVKSAAPMGPDVPGRPPPMPPTAAAPRLPGPYTPAYPQARVDPSGTGRPPAMGLSLAKRSHDITSAEAAEMQKAASKFSLLKGLFGRGAGKAAPLADDVAGKLAPIRMPKPTGQAPRPGPSVRTPGSSPRSVPTPPEPPPGLLRPTPPAAPAGMIPPEPIPASMRKLAPQAPAAGPPSAPAAGPQPIPAGPGKPSAGRQAMSGLRKALYGTGGAAGGVIGINHARDHDPTRGMDAYAKHRYHTGEYNQQLSGLNLELEAAQRAGDTTKIDELTSRMASNQFGSSPNLAQRIFNPWGSQGRGDAAFHTGQRDKSQAAASGELDAANRGRDVDVQKLTASTTKLEEALKGRSLLPQQRRNLEAQLAQMKTRLTAGTVESQKKVTEIIDKMRRAGMETGTPEAAVADTGSTGFGRGGYPAPIGPASWSAGPRYDSAEQSKKDIENFAINGGVRPPGWASANH